MAGAAERIRQGRGWGQVRGLAVAKDPKYAGGQVVSFQLAVRGDANDLTSFADVPVVFHDRETGVPLGFCQDVADGAFVQLKVISEFTAVFKKMSPAAVELERGQALRAAAPGGEAASPAEALRLKGNRAMGRRDWVSAAAHYTAGLGQEPGHVGLLNNRALAYLKQGDPKSAIEDCAAVLAEDAGNVKALLRRGLARKELRQWDLAAEDCRSALRSEPGCKDASALLEELERKTSIDGLIARPLLGQSLFWKDGPRW